MRRILFLLIFGLLGTGILISLGNWQMRRLAWKEGVIATIEARISAPPVVVPAAPTPENDRYLPIKTDAVIETGELHVLASLKGVGPGYLIIAPVRLPDGRRVMLERGFAPIADKDTPRNLGPITITGNLQWPRELFSSTPASDLAGNIWFAREVPQMARALKTEPILIISREATAPGLHPLPVAVTGITNDHWQYAVTWYLLALVWAIMTGYFLWRGRAAPTNKES